MISPARGQALCKGRNSAVIRELALIKVATDPIAVRNQQRTHLFELATVFKARIVDLAPESLMLELTGSASKIEGLIQVLKESEYEILEISRTGRMAMRRGHHTSRVMKALGDTSKRKPETKPRLKKTDLIPSEFPEKN